MSTQPQDTWPFPARQRTERTVAILAEQVIADPNRTPQQLENAMVAQGLLVESHMNAGRHQVAREAARVVLQLNQMRTPETVAQMEAERGLK